MNKDYPLVDKNGLRFRWIGKGCKEYEPTRFRMGNLVEAPVGELEESGLKKKEPEDRGICPFKSGLGARCGSACAWYASGCAIVTREDPETDGKRCPFMSYKCADRCVMRSKEHCLLLRNIRREN